MKSRYTYIICSWNTHTHIPLSPISTHLPNVHWISTNPKMHHGQVPTDRPCPAMPTPLGQTYVYSWVNIVVLLAVHLVHINLPLLRLWLFCDYRNCGSTSQAGLRLVGKTLLCRARPHGTAFPSNCRLHHCLPRCLQKNSKITNSAASASEDFVFNWCYSYINTLTGMHTKIAAG